MKRSGALAWVRAPIGPEPKRRLCRLRGGQLRRWSRRQCFLPSIQLRRLCRVPSRQLRRLCLRLCRVPSRQLRRPCRRLCRVPSRQLRRPCRTAGALPRWPLHLAKVRNHRRRHPRFATGALRRGERGDAIWRLVFGARYTVESRGSARSWQLMVDDAHVGCFWSSITFTLLRGGARVTL